MANSKLRTTPAVLRQILGLTVSELAQLVGRSVSAIQSVENGRLKLSENLAEQLAQETGVSLEWLLDGDPSIPPIADEYICDPSEETETFHPVPFTRQIFEERRARKGFEGWEYGRLLDCGIAEIQAFLALPNLLVALTYAYRQRKNDAELYRLSRAVSEFIDSVSAQQISDPDLEKFLKNSKLTLTSPQRPDGAEVAIPSKVQSSDKATGITTAGDIIIGVKIHTTDSDGNSAAAGFERKSQ